MDFGDRLKQLRKEKKLTQQGLADKSDVAVSSIINYENKRRKNPPVDIAVKLAAALDVDPTTLIRGPETAALKKHFADKLEESRGSRNDMLSLTGLNAEQRKALHVIVDSMKKEDDNAPQENP